jgi:uncharacterized RDD family membrane protein YckC
MTCTYCGSRNRDGEHRCGRCGRRPGDTLTGDVVVHRTQGQLAMQPEMHPVEPPPQRALRGYQPPLFPSASNVIPIESYVPVEPRPKPQRADAAPPKPRAPRRSRVPEEQGSLDFLAPAPPKPRTLSTTVEAMIFCDAPVAVWLHRAVAAAIDWSIVLIAYGIFLALYHQVGGEFSFNKTTLGMFGAVLPLLGFVYGMMWACAGAESFGMQATRLKLLTFEGFPPDKRQRMFRVLGSALSLGIVIGAAWSIVDEEGLGWQDHISRTFPSPSTAENLTLVRK